MTSSVTTRIFARDVYARTQGEVQAALQIVAARETNFVDITPQQRAWFIGARCALAWVLGLPRGGRKMAELVDGVATPGVVSLHVADDWMTARRDVLAGFSAGNFNTGE